MNGKFFALALASLLLTGGLDQQAMLQKLVPKGEDDQSRQFIELLRSGKFGAAEKMLAPNLQGEQAAKAMDGIHLLFAQDAPLEIEVVDYTLKTNLSSSPQTQTTLSYQIHSKERWFLGILVLDQNGSGTEIIGFHFYPMRDSLENINRFTLIDKSPVHYAFLVLCILIPIFILYTLVLCIRTPVRRKWLWILFIIFGFVQFHFNWTTGTVNVEPISILLFGASYLKNIYGPMILSLGIPVGALVFLFRRKSMRPKPPIRQSVS